MHCCFIYFGTGIGFYEAVSATYFCNCPFCEKNWGRLVNKGLINYLQNCLLTLYCLTGLLSILLGQMIDDFTRQWRDSLSLNG